MAFCAINVIWLILMQHTGLIMQQTEIGLNWVLWLGYYNIRVNSNGEIELKSKKGGVDY